MRSFTNSDQGFPTLVVLEIETRLVDAALASHATHATHAASADVPLDASHATDATDGNDVNASHVNRVNGGGTWTKKDVHPIGSQRMGHGCR